MNLQRDALKAAGCKKIVEDTASGGKVQTRRLGAGAGAAPQGDVLAVWRLDRLGRSLKHLIEQMAELEGEGIGFQSTTEAIDTTPPCGKLVFHIFAALAEFERNLIRERTRAGLEAARARGRKGGRKRKHDAGKRALAGGAVPGEAAYLEADPGDVRRVHPDAFSKYVREAEG